MLEIVRSLEGVRREYDAVSGILKERGQAWFDASATRRSWRSYDGQPVPNEHVDALIQLAEEFVPYPDARCVVLRQAPDEIFKGIVGSYGGVTGAPHALLMLVRETPHAQQHAGYTGEALILDATARDIDTCWIGGAFDRERVAELVELAEDERVVAISPLGFHVPNETLTDQLMHSLARSHNRKGVAEIAPQLSDEWPAWARVAVECARRAPSAMNRQPWRFTLAHEQLVLHVVRGRERPELTRALDCGIAMLHAQIGARQTGVETEWAESTKGGELARMRVTGEVE